MADPERSVYTVLGTESSGSTSSEPDRPGRGPGDDEVPLGSIWILVAANALVFFSSLCIMVLELVAARLVAQHLGVSLYTWTSVIGVILAGISLGNALGGRMADRWSPRALLPMLLLAASVTSLGVLWLNHLMEQLIRPDVVSWPAWVVFNVAVIFLLPAAALGTISPVVAKMALEVSRRIGSTVGNIYAWGAVGSIVGTFLTGFFLIDLMGTRAIVAAVATALGLLGLAIALWRRMREAELFAGWLALLAAALVLAFGPWSWTQRLGHFLLWRPDRSYLDYYDESNYFTIEVYEDQELEDTKVLALDNLVHSYVPTDDVTDLVYDYETIYAAVTDRVLDRRDAGRDGPSAAGVRAFFIGGGGFVFPRYLERTYPVARIDVAEIDPAVKRAAQEALGLPPDSETAIRTHLMDARKFVDERLRRNRELADDRAERASSPEAAARTGGSSVDGAASADAPEPAGPVRYDFVYGDAFNDLSVPWHLTTREFNDEIRRLLAPRGVYMINVIDALAEGKGRFLGAYVDTALETFPCVYVFSSDADGPTDARDTFVVVSAVEPLDLHRLGERPGDLEFEGRLFAWSEHGEPFGLMEEVLERGRGTVLTDDYAPVDNLLAPLFGDR